MLARPHDPSPSHDWLRATALALASCVLSASIPSVALAAPAEEAAPINTETKAMEAYEGGKAAYDAGEYEEALKLFLDAQSLYPSPVFHFNVGLCHEAMESWQQAVISYEAYLRSYQNAFGEDPEDKINTENKIERINRLLELEQAEADKPVEPVEPVAPPPVEPVDETPAAPGRGLIITGGALAGVGVAVAAIGGAVFGLQAADASNQLDAVYNAGNPERVTLAQAQTLDARGRSAQLNQILMLSIGGAVALTGVALLAVGVSKKSKAGKASASLLPTAGPRGAGLVLHGQF